MIILVGEEEKFTHILDNAVRSKWQKRFNLAEKIRKETKETVD